MNRENCSDGFATDRVFERTPLGSCDTPLVPVYAVTVLILVLRSVAAAKKWWNYYQRKLQRVKTSSLGPVLATCLATSYACVAILFTVDVINVDNGFSFAAYSLGYLFFAAIYSLSLLRMVRLGTKIITAAKELGNDKSLEHFDCSGYFLLTLAATALFLMSIVLIFIGPIFPEHSVLLGQIGWSSKGVFQGLITLGLMRQLERCHTLVEKRMSKTVLKIAVQRKLRFSQLHYFCFGMPYAIFYVLLGTRAILWYWWTAYGMTAMGESLAAVVFEFRFALASPTKTSSAKPEKKGFKSSIPSAISSHQLESNEPISSNTGPPLRGLGIIRNKFSNRKRFQAKMTRVSEAVFSEEPSDVHTVANEL